MHSPALRNSAPPEREKAFFGYVALVCVVALALLIPALPELRGVPAHSPATYWLLAVLAVVADLRPFPPPGGQRSVVFPSICFTFAILLMWGFAAAVVVQTAAVVASAVCDRVRGRRRGPAGHGGRALRTGRHDRVDRRRSRAGRRRRLVRGQQCARHERRNPAIRRLLVASAR
jgi:hypothetical protein